MKRKWAKDISEKIKYTISYQKIYEIRKCAEGVMPAYYTYDDLCDEMIQRLQGFCFENSLSSMKESTELKDLMYQVELKNELESLAVNEEHISLLKKSSFPKAILSDMYCGAEFLWDLLKGFGIDCYFDRVFVSCDYKAGKIDKNKSLYKVALEEFQISSGDAVMYDDSELCLEYAKRNGIPGKRIKESLYKKSESDYKKSFNAIQKEINRSYRKVASLSNYVETFYLFIERLYKQCVRDGIENVFFLSREGEFLKRLFDEYCKTKAQIFKTEYVYVSRKAVLRAGFSTDPYCPGEKIEKAFKYTSIESILNYIGFSEIEINKYRQITGRSIDEVIEDYWKSTTWNDLCDDKEFLIQYEFYVKKNRDMFSRYLEQVGFSSDVRTAIVDVGWKGTMQDSLKEYVYGSNVLFGYYFGLTPFAKSDAQSVKRGLVFSGQYGFSNDYEIWSFYHTQLESILTASHPGTVSYECAQDGSVCPVFQAWGTEEISYRMMAPIQVCMMDKFKRICSALEQNGYDGEDFYLSFLKTHIKTTLVMGYRKSSFLKQLQYNQIENFKTGKSNSSDMKHSYSLAYNFKRIFSNLDTLKNPVRMIRILQTNRLNFLIPCVVWRIKKQFLRQVKYR